MTENNNNKNKTKQIIIIKSKRSIKLHLLQMTIYLLKLGDRDPISVFLFDLI